VWDAAYDMTIKLLYGTAFRAPSYNELYSINNPVTRGNPNLKPEKIRTLEAVAAWQARRDLELRLSVFRYRMKNILRTVPNPIPGTGNTFQNSGDQTGNGFEVETVWDATRNVRLVGNYAYQHSTDETTQRDAGHAPHHHANVRGDVRFAGPWLASVQLNGVADRRREAGDNRPPSDDYVTLDLALRSERGKNRFNFAALVRNLFDADVREPSFAPGSITNDLPQAGRAFYVTTTYAF
jgi:iron complex outermembrane receptor protein